MFLFVFFRKKVKRLSASQNNTPFRFLFTRLWSKIRASTFFIWHLLYLTTVLCTNHISPMLSQIMKKFIFLASICMILNYTKNLLLPAFFFADSFCFTVKEQKEIIRNINWIKLNIMIFAVSTRFCLYKRDYITQH